MSTVLPPTHFAIYQEEKKVIRDDSSKERESQELQINLQKRYDDALSQMKELKDEIHQIREKKRDVNKSYYEQNEILYSYNI